MSHRDKQEEMGSKAPPPQCLRKHNTPIEGGRPRWRPCHLNSQEEQGNIHYHHHYHRQSHQQQLGTKRVPPRRSRKHVPNHVQRGSSESRDAELQFGGRLCPGELKYKQNGDAEHHHRHRQQPEQIHAAPQPLDVPEIDTTTETFSSEESSQELRTPSSQEALTPAYEERTISLQEVLPVEKQDGGSPGLHCSSSTKSSLHAQSEQPEDHHGEREHTDGCKGRTDEWDVEGGQEEKEETEVHKESEHEEQPQVDKDTMEYACSSTGIKKSSRRAGPIRVDVPPFAEFPLKGCPVEQNSGPIHLISPSYTNTSTDVRPECRSAAQSCEETFADSSLEAGSTTHPSIYEFCPQFHSVTPADSDRQRCHLPQSLWYQEQTEEQRSVEKNNEMPTSEANPQLSLHPEQRAQDSVGSRLHHYDEHSGDEIGSPGRGRCKVRRRTSVREECTEIIKEQCEVHTHLTALDREEKPEYDSVEGQHATHEPGNVPGDAISLAIRDIKDAIEEVKTKTVRSPYTPGKPKEPVWVMRRDKSPEEEECGSQIYSPPQTPLRPLSPPNTTCSQDLASDAVVPLGAESSRSHDHQEVDISPSLPTAEELRRNLDALPTYVDVAGPCDPEDLIDGIIFAASFLGSTQLLSEKTPSKSARMQQAQEAMSHVRQAAGGEVLSTTEVDLFVSTQRIKVLNADSQETMMDHPLRTISYIADIGNMVVLMARRKMSRPCSSQEQLDNQPTNLVQDERRQYRMLCHVFESEDAHLIAQSIGQSFSVAYQEFLRANGIDPEDLSQREYSDLLNTQDMYNDDLIHFSKSENCRDVYIEKQKGEILGVVIVESGWGSILPTVIIASLMQAGPAAKSGGLNIGDQIMTVNGTSLVGLPLSTCQSIIKGLKSQSRIKMNIVRCPPVTMVLIRRPDLRYQLGFSVQNGIVCSLMRGGIAERGGVRVGHRIIEINGQSVVATPHEKIVNVLSSAVGEVHMKTMPAAMYRLLTAQEQPVYI